MREKVQQPLSQRRRELRRRDRRRGRELLERKPPHIHAALPVKPERVDDFIEASRLVALGSVQNEPGCLRLDVHQTRKQNYEDHAPTTPVDDRSLLWLYEVYANQEALQYHTTTPHIKKWEETVKDWYAGEPPPAYRGRNLWPPDNWGWSSGKPRA